MPQTQEDFKYRLPRILIQRSLAFIYFIAFLIAANQFVPLLGSRGILPISLFLKEARFLQSPSLFLFYSSDLVLRLAAWSGVGLSLFALSGFSERFGVWISALVWTLMWALYLSFVNAGQTFYGFGWETLLLECGFLAIFLGDARTRPPALVIWCYRWVIFRVMFGAGLIKIRGDACWRDLTCMNYHYETQPLPNPLSWNFHYLPQIWHKVETFSTHFIELVLPFALLIPGRAAAFAGAVTILFHVTLIFSGNLSWLNYVTIVAALACFEDRFLKWIKIPQPEWRAESWGRKAVLIGLGILIASLSVAPAVNLFSASQKMNASFEPLHLVNTYGAFGSITRVRDEIILEGTDDLNPSEASEWKEYEFKCKPGNVMRAPCVVSPYHYKIDWQMWFAAMSDFRYHPWIFSLIARLLENNPGSLSLIQANPFPENPPKYIRAVLYRYEFTTPEERKRTRAWWKRTYRGIYLNPLSLDNPQFQRILQALGYVPGGAA